MRTAIKLIRLFSASYSMSLRRELAFRGNFVFDILLAILGLASALGVVQLVFTQTGSLAGWTKPEMFVLVGTFQLLTGIKATFIDPNLSWFPGRGIREGRLDNQLLQPAPTLFLVSFGSSAPLALIQVVLGLVVVGLGVAAEGEVPSAAGVAAWVLLVAVGVVVAWMLGILLACLAFWAPKLELDVFYSAAWELGRYPIDIYRKPLRFALTYLFPIALVSTVPANTLLSEPQVLPIVASIAGAGVAVVLATTAWRLGLRRYTGATS